MKKIKLAIVSDLHCHPRKDTQNSTYLYSDILRTKDHPIENLSQLLKEEKVDYVLCPGDVTDKCNTQGFISGWNYLIELKEHFKAKKIIATIGNHDVDSRGNNSTYSYTNVRGIKKGYPFENNDKKVIEDFFAKGFALIEEEYIYFLVIDSCFYHQNKEESIKGKILSDTIDEINIKLKGLCESKYKILLLHHHPILHSRKGLGEEDVLANGAELISTIVDNNFDLIIHGHKHDPWLRYENNIAIFSSGSFSSVSNLQYTSDRNMFHIIEICEKAKGQIKTWTYLPHNGWSTNFDSSNNLPPICGFGFNDILSIKNEIINLFNEITHLEWSIIEEKIPSIRYLMKEKLEELITELKEDNFFTYLDRGTFYPEKLIKLQ